MFDVLIIGSGPAGLTAGIYTSRGGKKTAILTGMMPGGQLVTTNEVENFPGFKTIAGPDLMDEMIAHANFAGCEIINGVVKNFRKEDDIFKIWTEDKEFFSKSVIVATGSSSKLLGLEEKFWGKGISTCATCDGNFFKNKPVAVIGGGNSAFEEAIYLSNIASKVYLIHRSEIFKSEYILQNRLNKIENIEIIKNTSVVEFYGNILLEGMKLYNNKENINYSLDVKGVFIAIGHYPNSEILKNHIELDSNGYATQGPVTEIAGLFVAGDVFDNVYRQAITSAGYGCMAGIEAMKFLNLS